MTTRLLVMLGMAVGGVWASPAEEKLIQSLLANYESSSRPVTRTGESLTINVSFVPIKLDVVDVDDNRLMLHGWVKLSWKDVQLKWNASDHDEITILNLPIETLWKPDLRLYNAYELSVENTLTLVSSDGTVLWVPPLSGEVTCNLSAIWFPFDIQRCTLVFGSWTYDKTKIDLQVGTDLDNDVFMQNSEWKLISTESERREKKYVCCENAYPSVQVTLTIQRKACRHVVERVVPLIAVVTLALLTMMIPATKADIRLLIVTLLLGSALVHLRSSDESVPENLSILTVLNGLFIAILSGLFLCNCTHLAILRGHMDCSFLAKLTGLVGADGTAGEKSEALISDVEQRYHRTLDSVFTVPLAFVATLSTVLFFSVPLF